MRTSVPTVALVATFLFATACSKSAQPDPSLAAGAGNGSTSGAPEKPAANDRLGGQTPEKALDDAIEVALKTVYFEFDSYALTAEAQENLRTMAAALKADPTLKLVVEGHTDARGSNEYNLSLSLKRAEAIKDFLSSEGVPPEAMDVAGKGEETPAVEGITEEAYSKNRRGEFRKSKR